MTFDMEMDVVRCKDPARSVRKIRAFARTTANMGLLLLGWALLVKLVPEFAAPAGWHSELTFWAAALAGGFLGAMSVGATWGPLGQLRRALDVEADYRERCYANAEAIAVICANEETAPLDVRIADAEYEVRRLRQALKQAEIKARTLEPQEQDLYYKP
jgi:hypothetical protein